MRLRRKSDDLLPNPVGAIKPTEPATSPTAPTQPVRVKHPPFFSHRKPIAQATEEELIDWLENGRPSAGTARTPLSPRDIDAIIRLTAGRTDPWGDPLSVALLRHVKKKSMPPQAAGSEPRSWNLSRPYFSNTKDIRKATRKQLIDWCWRGKPVVVYCGPGRVKLARAPLSARDLQYIGKMPGVNEECSVFQAAFEHAMMCALKGKL